MNTLQAEKDLIDIFVQAIDQNTNDNIKAISARDYTNERGDVMVVVGCDGFTNANPMLPDYDYTINILIDSFIKGDQGGSQFQKAKQEVLNYLQTYLMDKTKLGELFVGFPVVGMFISGVANSTTEESNRTNITLQVIASFGE